MPLIILALLLVLAILLVYRSQGSARHDTYIEISPAAVQVRRGFVPPQALSAVVDILRGARVSTGYIAISADNRVTLSWHIPPALHQQLRNVLLRDRAVHMPRGMRA